MRYCLGPSVLGGDALETADISIFGLNEFAVNPVFREGAGGIDAFNVVAAECFVTTETCPTRRLAIVLDQRVVSAPEINASEFRRDSITISGSFDEESARDLALVLRYGALPINLEPQAVRTVSATIGTDSLRAGVISGLVGLALVSLYLLAYYRLAALVAITGIGVAFMLLWTIISWMGETRGLAITLAGVVGLVVSIGVSADSNIVYFENVKDLTRDGKRPGTAIERAYKIAIGTIVKADVVSLIAAVLLYFLTVGAVKGFALYLGLATVLDLVISVWFMRPALAWLSRLPAVRANPRLLGLTGAGATPARQQDVRPSDGAVARSARRNRSSP
jgi:preprotein translocase subunit SecD